MNNNDIFSLKRFGLLLKKDLLENGKKYLIYILLILGALTLMFIWSTYNYKEFSGYQSLQKGDALRYYYNKLSRDFFYILFVFGALAASIMMSPMNRKNKRITYLMQPSSSLEKFMARWLVLTIGYIIVLVLVFFPADVIRVLFGTICYPELDMPFYLTMWNDTSFNEDSSTDNSTILLFLISFYTFIQSLFVLGSTFWQKNSAIKTFVAGLIIFAVFLIVCGAEVAFFFEKGMEDFMESTYLLSSNTVFGFMGILFIILTLINWILAYFRFKESEIINRL